MISVLLIIGFGLIFYGLILFVKAIFTIIKALTIPFWSEKKMDEELFKEMRKGEDYKAFERNIDGGNI